MTPPMRLSGRAAVMPASSTVGAIGRMTSHGRDSSRVSVSTEATVNSTQITAVRIADQSPSRAAARDAVTVAVMSRAEGVPETSVCVAQRGPVGS